jgi:hypothetical protein
VKHNKIKKFNCCPKLSKPVVIPTRKEVVEILDDIKPFIVNQFYSVDELIQDLGLFIGQRFNIDVKHAEATQVDQNDIELNGYYDGGLDEAGDVPIEIYLVTNPLQDVMIIDEEGFNAIARKIADTLSHEVIHMHQYRARDFLEVEKWDFDSTYEEGDEEYDEAEENRWYLSSPDEINAYAYNIANELLDKNSLPVVMEKLNKLKNISIEDSVNLWAYVHAFEQNTNHPVLRRLIKKVYKSLTILSR